ncbi:MAG TPA: M20/M25/M40 family metallo-hydrolase [Anaerolineae bacterium]|nr:M20/M25/M40 family metallo-hydrolase [Anaerolineae bacterium]
MADSPLDTVLERIDAEAARCIANLQRVMRQPSVTDNEADCQTCAALVADLLRDVGMNAQVLPSKHNPVVVAASPPRPNVPTLLITTHYDVVSPDPVEEWSSPPFAAELRNGDIIGRGAADPKGNLMAGIEAVRAWREVAGELPVNIKFMVEGDDEVETGHLGEFVTTHKELLRADSVLLLDAGYTRDGNSPIHLGTAGSLAVELSVTTGSKEPYFIWTQLIPDAAYRLVWALASLKDQNERVVIEGFYDRVKPPTPEEQALMDKYPWQDEGDYAFWGINEFVTGARGTQAIRRLLYEPTCSIHGIEPGLERPNASSLIPNHARAWVNFHLVPDQDPDEILELLKNHLARHHLGDVQIKVLRNFRPIAGSANSPLGHALLRAAQRVGIGSYLLPHSFEFGDKWCWLGQLLGVEGALIGVADPDRRAHFVNEHISVPYYISGIKWVAAAIWEYGQANK